MGRRVDVLIDGESKDPGTYRARWGGMNGSGNRVASGLYFCVLKSADGVNTRKMILLR